MHRTLPTREQIQEWVLRITPYAYLERFVGRPGLLVLRAKQPVCEWRGLHIALSEARREAVVTDLLLLHSRQTQQLQYRSSNPDGRAWFNLFTSGVNFGSWGDLSIDLDSSLPDGDVWVRYIHSSVQLRLSPAALSVLAAELAHTPSGGMRSQLRLMRDVKPSSDAHNLWFWQWVEHAVAGEPFAAADLLRLASPAFAGG